MSNNDICALKIGSKVDIGCTDNANVCEELYGYEFEPRIDFNNKTCPTGIGYYRCEKVSHRGRPEACCLQPQSVRCDGINSCDPDLYTGSTPCSNFIIDMCGNSVKWNENRDFCRQAYLSTTDQTRSTVFFGIFDSGIRGAGIRDVAQSDLYAICHSMPHLCRSDLFGLCSRYTLTDVNANRNVAELCGCFLSSADIYEYSATGIARECIPPCTNMNAVKLATGPGAGGIVPCTSGICVIDDVAINIARSKGGNIDVSQTCVNCSGAATCRCDIYNVDIDITGAEFENINLSQECFGTANCYDKRTGLQIPCGQSTENTTDTTQRTTYEIISWISISVVTILVLFVFLFLFIRQTFKSQS